MFAGKDIDYSAATIRNDGFWPDVAVADFERRRALPADLDQQTTGAALLAAVSEINLQLASHQTALQGKGYTTAAEVPGPSLEGGNNALTEQYLAEFGTQSVSMEGVKQAAEILNRIPGNKQELVARLRARDPEIASAIETEMYDFFVLSTQSETTLTQIIEAVPAELWALALKGAEPAVRKAVLGAMPRRQAQSFEDQMRRSGPVPLSRVEQARREIMDLVKAMVDAGELEIQLFAEAVVE